MNPFANYPSLAERSVLFTGGATCGARGKFTQRAAVMRAARAAAVRRPFPFTLDRGWHVALSSPIWHHGRHLWRRAPY